MDKEEEKETQNCPNCGFPIGVVAGSQEAICKNCGFKDPCCE
jgi:predicted RNA-binding Zn-ribbon protein involved in translation (DUF1610 family)